MPPNLLKCGACRKLFIAFEDHKLCKDCADSRLRALDLIEEAMDAWGLDSVSEIAQFAGLSERETRQLIHETGYLRRKAERPRVCSRCRREAPQEGSEYCLACRMTLNRALGQVTERLAEALGALPPKPREGANRSRLDVLNALEERRRVSPAGDRRFTPRNRYSS